MSWRARQTAPWVRDEGREEAGPSKASASFLKCRRKPAHCLLFPHAPCTQHDRTYTQDATLMHPESKTRYSFPKVFASFSSLWQSTRDCQHGRTEGSANSNLTQCGHHKTGKMIGTTQKKLLHGVSQKHNRFFLNTGSMEQGEI